MRVQYSNGRVIESAVIQVWDDMSAERDGFYRAFWCESPEATSGSPVIGYCSAGGSHRTIRAVIAEVRRLGYSDPVYRNGRLISGMPDFSQDNPNRCNPRDYPIPTVAKCGNRYCVIGTQYGYLHTSGGYIRTWGSVSGARKAIARYVPF